MDLNLCFVKQDIDTFGYNPCCPFARAHETECNQEYENSFYQHVNLIFEKQEAKARTTRFRRRLSYGYELVQNPIVEKPSEYQDLESLGTMAVGPHGRKCA